MPTSRPTRSSPVYGGSGRRVIVPAPYPRATIASEMSTPRSRLDATSGSISTAPWRIAARRPRSGPEPRSRSASRRPVASRRSVGARRADSATVSAERGTMRLARACVRSGSASRRKAEVARIAVASRMPATKPYSNSSLVTSKSNSRKCGPLNSTWSPSTATKGLSRKMKRPETRATRSINRCSGGAAWCKSRAPTNAAPTISGCDVASAITISAAATSSGGSGALMTCVRCHRGRRRCQRRRDRRRRRYVRALGAAPVPAPRRWRRTA